VLKVWGRGQTAPAPCPLSGVRCRGCVAVCGCSYRQTLASARASMPPGTSVSTGVGRSVSSRLLRLRLRRHRTSPAATAAVRQRQRRHGIRERMGAASASAEATGAVATAAAELAASALHRHRSRSRGVDGPAVAPSEHASAATAGATGIQAPAYHDGRPGLLAFVRSGVTGHPSRHRQLVRLRPRL
jgi:hypothetical protein